MQHDSDSVTCSDAPATTSFLLLVAMPLLLVAMRQFFFLYIDLSDVLDLSVFLSAFRAQK